MEKIRVLIVDDHTVFRQGLCKLLEAEEDICVIGEASDGSEAIEMVKNLGPDIVLMDIEMPNVDGIKATTEIKEMYPNTEVVALTAYEDDEHLFKAIRAGSTGYISKHSSADEIVEAIKTVSRGESMITPSLSRRILKKFTSLSKMSKSHRDLLWSDLTKREIEILKLLCEGKTNSQIAEILFISERTVKNHIYNIYQKLQCNTRTEAMLKGIKLGLLDLDE
ncbi:MAG: response regulator transcription factor [Actinomycetota bacterium]